LRTQVAALLDQSFGLKPNQHYLEDFPIWDLNFLQPHSKFFHSTHQKELAAVAFARTAVLQPHQLRIGMIGGVATLPKYQKQGIGGALLQKAIDWLDAKDSHSEPQSSTPVDAILLWSTETAYYQKFGFQPFGVQIRCQLDTLLVTHPTAISAPLGIQEGWHDAIFELIQRRSEGLVLESSDITWYRAHRNTQWYSLWSQNKPIAYVAIGRGIDLPDLVHQWGGEPSVVLSILQSIATARPFTWILGNPELFSKLQLSADANQVTHLKEPLCLLRSGLSNPTPLKNLWVWGLDAC
jgi:GNAT superfamily N-acetyltransferase